MKSNHVKNIVSNGLIRTFFAFSLIIVASGCGGGGGGSEEAPYENPDHTAPYISAVSPFQNEMGVGINCVISATFSEGMNRETISTGSFIVLNGVSQVAGKISYDNYKATFTPSSPLAYGTTYTASIKKTATDLSGNRISTDYIWQFTTVLAPAPEINLAQGSNSLQAGSGSYHFSSIVAGNTSTASFTIQNTGSADLSIHSVSISGTNADQFSLNTSSMSSTVQGGSATAFTVTFHPTSAGSKSATVTVVNSDSDEGSYTFTVNGEATAAPEPEINIKKGSITINNGAQGHDFGSVIVGSSSSAVSFTVENSGSADLIITGVSDNSDQFSVNTDGVDYSLAPGETTVLTVTFSPTSTGNRNAMITIINNDSDEGTYTFNVTGNGSPIPAPEINVREGSGDVLSGGTVDFSSVPIDSSKSLTFAIQNLGTADLHLTGDPYRVEISGTNASAFVIDPQPSSPVQPGQAAQFSLKFTPDGVGSKNASVKILSNDSDESVYTFAIKGMGTDIAPLQPNNLTASADTSSLKVQLQWNDMSNNEQGFKIERSTDGINFTEIATVGANVTSYTDITYVYDGFETGYLNANAWQTTGEVALAAEGHTGMYSARIRAPYEAGTGSYLKVVVNNSVQAKVRYSRKVACTQTNSYNDFHFQIDSTYMETDPDNSGWEVREYTVNPGNHTLQWLVWQGHTNASGYAEVDNITVYTGPSWLVPDSVYYYRVRAYNGIGPSAYSNSASVTTPKVCSPIAAQPTDLRVELYSATGVRLAWKDNSSNESGFSIERKIDGGEYAQIAVVSKDYLSYIDKGLESGTKYYYRIKAVNPSYNSSYSNEEYCRYRYLLKWGTGGAGDGQFNSPKGIAVSQDGYVYVADYNNNRIQKFDSSGNFLLKWGSNGTDDGQFNKPNDVAVDSANNVYVADRFNHRIQKFDSNGIFLLKWGSQGSANDQLYYPRKIITYPGGNVYVGDSSTRVRKFGNGGEYQKIWYAAQSGIYGLGVGISDCIFILSWDGNTATSGGFERLDLKTDVATQLWSGYEPMSMTTDISGNVYVYLHNSSGYGINYGIDQMRIHKFDSNGNFLYGIGSDGSSDGTMGLTEGIACDASGNLYISDTGNNRIQKFAPVN